MRLLDTYRLAWYNAETLWLFTASDIKSIMIPNHGFWHIQYAVWLSLWIQDCHCSVSDLEIPDTIFLDVDQSIGLVYQQPKKKGGHSRRSY